MTEGQTKTKRWIKVVLALSLTLNLLIVGVAGGAMFKGRELRDARPDADGMAIVTRALPMRYQANVRREIRDRVDEIRASRETMIALRRDLAGALTADPFDLTVVEDLFAQQREVLSGLALAGHDIVLEQIGSMDADDRAAYATNLLRNRHDGPPRDR